MKNIVMAMAGVAFAAMLSVSAQAGIIISGDGNETCIDLIDGGGSCTEIVRHSAWQVNNPLGNGAKWISYAATGVGQGAQPPVNDNEPRMEILEELVVGGVHSVLLSITVWADDTAEFFIDGISHADNIVNFVQQTCAKGPLGCEPDEGITFEALLAPGTYDLSLEVWQLGNGPFGALYSGTTTEVPEPAILGFLGFGLLGMGIAARRRRRA